MVTINDAKAKLELVPLNDIAEDKEITDVCVCDLLSWVMAKGEQGMAWITVQTHLNVIGVASLHDFSCVIFPENVSVPQMTVDKATEEGIALFSTSASAYRVCAGLAGMGL